METVSKVIQSLVTIMGYYIGDLEIVRPLVGYYIASGYIRFLNHIVSWLPRPQVSKLEQDTYVGISWYSNFIS